METSHAGESGRIKHRAAFEAWAGAAQDGEFAFHERNAWRRSPQFAVDAARLWEHFGFRPDQYDGQTLLDIGAGSRLRTRYFTGCRLIAIEPLADRYRTLDFCDLHTAERCYRIPGEQLEPELVGHVDAVVSINALDHGYDFDLAIRNIAAYLKPEAPAFLSFDLHDDADEMHPLLLTQESCRAVFVACGLTVIRVARGVGPFGTYYGHGEAINFWLRRGDAA